MPSFAIDAHLLRECFLLGRLDLCHVMLMNNAALPWFILVPETTATEICDLEPDTLARLFAEANSIARHVRNHFSIDKLNIASIGNVVPQMHVHVIGRRRNDYCWPGPVWGTPPPARYAPETVAAVAASLATELGSDYAVAVDG
jgi:diadenosine tetraphosphate (Ap4A) HIT family hydrolase